MKPGKPTEKKPPTIPPVDDTPKLKRGPGAGVPFLIVKNALPEDSYHKRLKKVGYYAAALTALAAAPRGNVLRFESIKAQAGLTKAAKSLGYEILFAVDDGNLFVQILDTGADK